MSPRRAAALRDSGSERSLREHLVSTAALLIGQRGGAGLTVRDIARAAGVADGALYHHFADKEELLATALHRHVEAVMTEFHPLPEPGTGVVADNLAGFIRGGVATLASVTPAFLGFLGQPAVIARFHQDFAPMQATQSLPTQLMAYLRGEQELGRIGRDVDPAAVSALLVGACHDQIVPLLFQPPGAGPEMSDELVENLVATVWRGIAP